jgi:diaminohydroxyphosphoribosylaminopyrimidine deaminase/5-amino-6-(5-phosphoribosylamino)uracil reductase
VPSSSGALDLRFVLDELGRRGIRGVLVEGGGETAARFVEAGLADKLTLFYAPKFVGSGGVPMIGALRVKKMSEALEFSASDVEKVGEDVAVTLYPSSEEDRVHRAG